MRGRRVSLLVSGTGGELDLLGMRWIGVWTIG